MNNHSYSSSDETHNPYIELSHATPSGRRPKNTLFDVLNRCGRRVEDVTRKAEFLADNVWHHPVKVSPSLTDAAMARLAQGTMLLKEGGHEKVFQQTFETLPGEKLLKAYVCYLSNSSGPVSGTLYISNKRVAFGSDYTLCHYTSLGQPQWMPYKVLVHLDQLRTVNSSTNILNPSDKYIYIVTRDGYEFWFMGFISYDKALKNLSEALQHSRDLSVVISQD
ncbi:GRAM domain-containing protein [Cephalotus follicularis]|uniref:GRAM domain-containing protein n=1 Tax=Cephalotus follicularis TaxID=3775 RepID=A0A1Q3CG66_CEPFO|nr:GRAM domain-containing protein [Cephalotus follicularis]